ncbi:MAG: Ig-like domain-containing protein, partial [Chania sp.]
MNFSFLTDEDTLSFYPIDKVESLYLPIQSIEGARYIVTEKYGVDINESLMAERVNDDLHLKFYADSQTPSSIVIKDFALTNGKVFSLADNGEYRQHLSVEDMPLQGPVALTNLYLGVQQEQPEAVSLKVIQHAATLQTFETLGESLNPSSDVLPAQQDVTSFAEAMPLPAASLEANAAFNAIPAITDIYDQVGSRKGNLVSGSVTDDKQPKLEGTGQPGAELEIFQNGELIGLVSVDSITGRWSFTPSVPLQEGGQLFYVRDPATNQTSTNIVLIVDTVAPSRSTISNVVDADDTGATTAISQNGYTSENKPTLSGRGEANSMIAIYNGNALVGTTYAKDNGDWVFTPISPFPDGKYEFRAAGIDFSGNIGLSSARFIFTIDTVRPTQPEITELVDNVGAVTGVLINGATTDDNTPTLKGQGEAYRKVTLYDKGEKIGETTVDEFGKWEFTPETDLGEGEHKFTVVIEDLAGNQSEPSEPWVVMVDTTSPAAPTIDSIYDDVGSKTGELLVSGTVTDDTTPTLKGQAAKGATVEIFDKGEKIGETTANKDNGSWEFTPESLAEGDHSFTVSATNTAGKVSDLSQPWELEIDTTAPDKPSTDGTGAGIGEILDDQGTVTGPISDGDRTDDTKPTLKGEGEPGDKIIITDNGNKIGET